jgi:hypothetical protein
MHITLSPIRAETALSLDRHGETLVIDGEAFDLAPLAEGATLPQAAVACPALAGDITRRGGALHLALLLPHGIEAAPEVLFPAPLADPPDGAVALPGQATAAAAPRGPGRIDWARVIAPGTHAAEARARAETRLSEAIEAATLMLTGTVPLTEKLSWTAKEEAARAWVAGLADPAQRALLEGEAGVTGEDPGDLAARVLRNAEAWRLAIARLSGLRRRTVAALAAAPDPAAIEAVLAEGLAALAPG